MNERILNDLIDVKARSLGWANGPDGKPKWRAVAYHEIGGRNAGTSYEGGIATVTPSGNIINLIRIAGPSIIVVPSMRVIITSDTSSPGSAPVGHFLGWCVLLKFYKGSNKNNVLAQPSDWRFDLVNTYDSGNRHIYNFDLQSPEIFTLPSPDTIGFDAPLSYGTTQPVSAFGRAIIINSY